ncbi:MAG: flippase [Chloroflexota bacterium]
MTARPVVRSVAWLSASHALVLVVGLATAIVIARGGAEDLGRYRFAQAILMYLVVASDAGLTLLSVREIARRPADAVRYAGPVLVVRFVLSAVLFGVAATVVGVSDARDAAPFYLVMFASVFPLSLSLIHVLQGRERLRGVALVRMVSIAGAGAIGLVAYLVSGRLVALVVPTVVVGLLVDGVLLLFARHRLGIRLRWGTPPEWAALLVTGVPFLVTAVAVQLVSNADAVIIGTVRGESQLGLYAAAYVLAGQTLFLAGPIASAIYPRFSRLHSTPDRFREAIRKVFGAIALFIVPASIGAALLADAILGFLYGTDYEVSAPILAVLMGMPLIGFYNVAMSQVLYAAGRQASVARIAIIAAVVNVGTNLVLIPSVGLVGAAIAAVLTEVVTATAYTRTAAPITGLAPLRAYLSPFPAAFVMAVGVVLVRVAGLQPLIVFGGVIGTAVYAMAIVVRPPEVARRTVDRLIK